MAKFIETYRGVVAPAECDHLGHMNVQYYFAAVSDGMFGIMAELGLTPSAIRERNLSFAVVNAQTSFSRELVAGDVIRLLSTVEDMGTKSGTFMHQLERVEDGEVAFETKFKCVLLNLASRSAVEIPEDVRESMFAFMRTG